MRTRELDDKQFDKSLNGHHSPLYSVSKAQHHDDLVRAQRTRLDHSKLLLREERAAQQRRMERESREKAFKDQFPYFTS